MKDKIFIIVRQLIKQILREENDKRLEKLVGDYITTTYPTAQKIRVAVDGGKIELTTLTLPDPEDEKDNLIFKMDAYGMPDYKINPEFFNSVRSMFGGQNKIKKVIFKWFDEKEVDDDLLGSKKEEEPINEVFHEYFNFDNLKKGYDYYINLDKKKHPGADSFDRYKMIKAFQKWVDLIYKYAKIEISFDGVDGINVGTVWQDKWGENFSRPEDKISRMDYTVRVFPNIDKSNPPESKKQFEEDYEKFKEVFQRVADGIGIDYIDPVADKRARGAKVRFDFLKLGDSQLITKNELDETELTERCWKGYTQKGMKTMFGKRYPNCVKITKKKKRMNESNMLDYLKQFLSGEVLDNYKKEKGRKEFQKMVDMVYKITAKDNPIEGMVGVLVGNIDKSIWGHNFNDEKSVGSKWDFTVVLKPLFTDYNPNNEDDYDERVLTFEDKFIKNARGMGFEVISPIQHEKVKNYRVKFEWASYLRVREV